MANENSLKEDWKEVGIEVGSSVAKIGKSIFKSARVGAKKLENWADENKENPPQETGLLESWSDTGHTIGEAAADLGRAAVRTAKAGVRKAEELAQKDDDAKKE